MFRKPTPVCDHAATLWHTVAKWTDSGGFHWYEQECKGCGLLVREKFSHR